ncbi:MAG: hypothetical protein EAZ21_12955 [Betaproteobacteria bacterium]|nr:MAG: hypothetical protein EAZ21_12955 [Betaproteobacteria bacterium]
MNESDLGFSNRQSKNGDVSIDRQGRSVTTLRGKAAIDFIDEVEGLEHSEQQQLMARVTGNYKCGNERLASEHPRNKR